MYHHHSQQPGPPPFSNMPRAPPNQQQGHPSSDMMGYQFPRPTQLPDELESALAIRGSRDVDHRLMDQSNQHQNQAAGPGISQQMSEHGNYGSDPIMLSSDNQQGHQQKANWTSYQPSNKIFPSAQQNTGHQPLQGPQQPQNWTAPVADSSSSQAQIGRGGGGNGGGGDGQGLYTPESAGSILASFGLSNEDLEVLSHYPDDQLTPDTLPFILRDIQINKSSNQKTSTSSSFSSQPAQSRSPEVPSLLTVTQTAGKVIDYGHASRSKDENSTRETFKRERLSSERTVKIAYPSSSAPKVEVAERRQVRLEPAGSNRHGDRDYRRSDRDIHKAKRSPVRDFPPPSKSRHMDRDYRLDRARPRPSPETRSGSSPSRRSLSSSSGSKPHGSSKKLPTPTLISDFLAVPPKVYPHTCSVCDTQCDQEKDWIEHINTVNHTASCRDLRNKFPDWRPRTSRKSGRYGRPGVCDPEENQSPSRSVSRSLSWSPSPSPPPSKYRAGPYRLHGRPYPPRHHPRYHHHKEHGHRFESRRSGSHSPSQPHRSSSSSREYRPERRPGQSSGVSPWSAYRSGVKRPHDESTKAGAKPGTKTTKTGSAKDPDTSAEPPPLKKKKKKMLIPISQSVQSVAARLVYLTGIPTDASEQEVTDLVGSFGMINNVVLMPCSEEEEKKGEGQKASVCMVRVRDAEALAGCTNLTIRDQIITASPAKKVPKKKPTDVNNSKPGPTQDGSAAVEESGNGQTSDEKAIMVITGLPESGWSDRDIINLVEPFGTPSDIILATEIGKALVTLPNVETAEEMAKVNTFSPVKIKDSEVKMIHLKQRIGLKTPVALYNLLMGSLDPLENPVSWSSLLIISNVPETSGPAEVLKLVRRFGTVIKTLVLNSNLVICEMATPVMALSVYQRFHRFPCIIQNNPLSFSRKPDPKPNTRAKVITAFHKSSKVPSANGKDVQTAPAEDEEEQTKKLEAPSEEKEIETERDDQKTVVDEQMVGEEEAKEENQSPVRNEEVKQDELTIEDSNTSAASGPNPEDDIEIKTPPDEAVTQETEENKTVSASLAGNGAAPADEKETQPSSSDAEAASGDAATPELPKVTPAMVHALLEECRTTRSARHLKKPKAPPGGKLKEARTETTSREERGEKGEEATKEAVEDITEEELKKEEGEGKEREGKMETEVREKERKERDRRGWEREDSMRREREERSWRDRERREGDRWEWERRGRERRDEDRWEWERRDRERRDRRRMYDQGSPEWRSYSRYEINKRSSWKDEDFMSENRKEVEEDDFPFNMSDFVTVDEVGDVTDLPQSPPPDVPMETTEGGADTAASVQQDTLDAEATPASVKPEEHRPEAEPSASSERSASSDVMPDAASPSAAPQTESSSGQTDVPACQPEAATAPETVIMADLDSTLAEEAQPTPAPPSLDGPPEAAPPSLDGLPDAAPASLDGPPEAAPAYLEGPPEAAPASLDGPPEAAPASLDGPPDAALASLDGPPESALASLDGPPDAAPASLDGPPESAPASLDGPPDAALASLDGPPDAAPASLDGPPESAPASLDGPPDAALASLDGPPDAALASLDGPAEAAPPASDSPPKAAPASLEGPPEAAPASSDGPPDAALASLDGPAEAAPPASDSPPKAAPASLEGPPEAAPASLDGPPDAALASLDGPPDAAPPSSDGSPEAAADGPPEAGPASSDGPPEAGPAASSTEGPETRAVTEEKEEVKDNVGMEEKEEKAVNHSQAKAEEMVVESSEKRKEQMMEVKREEEMRPPASGTAKANKCEEDANTEEERVKKTLTPAPADFSLPPFDPKKAVGMEFLVPKTGFFCKVCNRFFTGTKEAEFNHCRTLKHYENLQKYLETRKSVNVTAKRDSS